MSIDYAEAARLIRRGRKAERRVKVLENFLTWLFTSLFLVPIKGFLLMLAVGVAHDHWVHALPTIGYGWACLIMWILPSTSSPSTKSGDS